MRAVCRPSCLDRDRIGGHAHQVIRDRMCAKISERALQSGRCEELLNHGFASFESNHANYRGSLGRFESRRLNSVYPSIRTAGTSVR